MLVVFLDPVAAQLAGHRDRLNGVMMIPAGPHSVSVNGWVATGRLL